MTRFIVRDRVASGSADAEYVVADTQDRSRPVAEFADRGAAQAHADKLNAGPLDWDQQDAWNEDDHWGDRG